MLIGQCIINSQQDAAEDMRGSAIGGDIAALHYFRGFHLSPNHNLKLFSELTVFGAFDGHIRKTVNLFMWSILEDTTVSTCT